MRQAGFLAAAGIYALDNQVARLAIDHRHAKAIEAALSEVIYVSNVLPVETNIIVFEIAEGFKATNIVHLLQEKGILCNTTGPGTVRMVTHLDISPEMVDVVIQNIIHLHPIAHK